MRTSKICLTLAVIACVHYTAAAAVVNIDFEAGLAGDATYAGDDAALSSPGGVTWTSVLYPGATNLRNEFGGVTSMGVELFDDFVLSNSSAGNVLQDSGAATMINVIGLDPGALYTIAGYVDDNGGFAVEDATGFLGFFGFGNPGANGWSLPGAAGNGGDYMLVSDIQPFEIEPGKWGFVLTLDGTLTGLQISGGGAPCPGDLDGDNMVGLSDLATLLANYGTPSGMTYTDGDLDGDGDVDLADLAALLALYGTDC